MEHRPETIGPKMTVSKPMQSVHALALRSDGGVCWTQGVFSGQTIADAVIQWRQRGYEVLVMSAELPL